MLTWLYSASCGHVYSHHSITVTVAFFSQGFSPVSTFPWTKSEPQPTSPCVPHELSSELWANARVLPGKGVSGCKCLQHVPLIHKAEGPVMIPRRYSRKPLSGWEVEEGMLGNGMRALPESQPLERQIERTPLVWHLLGWITSIRPDQD